jgi:hypothetical protein
MLKQVIITLDDSSQHQLLLDALDAAIRSPITPKVRHDYLQLKQCIHRQTINLERMQNQVVQHVAQTLITLVKQI